MKKNKWLSLALVLVLIFSLCTSAFAVETEQADSGERLLSSLRDPQEEPLQVRPTGENKAEAQVRAIVLTESRPTVENSGLIQRFLNSDSKLMREHSAVQKRMEQQGIGFKVNFEYTALLNGMSITVKLSDLPAVAEIPGVTKIILAREYKLPETHPSAVSASDMINATMLSNAISADGSGKVIAVLDTGITADHEAFAVYDGMLQQAAWQKTPMIKAIADLGHGMYYSQKIPYQFDYADQDNDAADDHSGHGSHVAGIAAGYVADSEGAVSFHGSAPDAQILAMKIFASDADTTSTDIYLAALEDAFKLGADVINMSIGAPTGFVEDDESALNDCIYQRLEEAGIICCVSAGNENNLSENAQNWAGPGYLTTGTIDYGMLGSPASYNGNVAVAALENMEYPAYQITIGENGFAYRECDGTAFLDQFAGQDLEYVMVPNLGEAEDYEDIDVRGKIAVISRGEITFDEKVTFASAAGAIGAVVYDNREGALVTMAIENNLIPAVFVSQEAGAALAALETKTFHVDNDVTVVENPDAWSMASFSSWGPTNDLQIKPTITGVGGNVNSVMAGTTSGYEVMSGTSMSAPNVSGGYAALLEAICADNPSLSKAEAAAIARNRTLSSAYPAIAYADTYDDENYFYVPYSPRQQGAGLLDLAAAYTAQLTIDDPLAELGDDPSFAGVYTIEATVQNISDTERTYAVSADVLTDGLTAGNFGTDEDPDYHFYNYLMPVLLEEGVDYAIDAPKTITLAPGEKKTVTVTITLSEEMMAGYLAYFPNGAFIDGYVYFDSVSDYESQHVTFLAFYGDWKGGAILETHDWRELMDLDAEQLQDWSYYVDWEIDTVPTEAYLVDDEYNPMVYAGDAPFGYPEGGAYSDKRIAVSYNVDEAYSTMLLVVPTILRNARHVVMIVRNADTGEIYAVDDTPYCTKTYYDATDGWVSYAWFLFDGTNSYTDDDAASAIPDDTAVVLEFYANLPGGDDALGSMTPEEIVADGADYLQYTVPCVVDGAAPVFENVEYDPESGELSFDVKDNQYLAAVYAMDMEGNYLAEMQLFADDQAGETHSIKMNVGEQEAFLLGALDYATNEGVKVVAADHEHAWTEWEVVTEPTCDEDGEQVRYCEICYEEESEAIPALGHTLVKTEEVPATCDTDGVKEYWTCEVCGKLFADEKGETEIAEPEVIPAGHTLEAVAEVPATCTEDGVKAYWKCSVCGKLFADEKGETEIAEPEVIPAAGHTLEAVAEVPATCEEDGVKAYWKCSVCGKLFADEKGETEIEAPEVIDALGHDWDDGVITKQPTLAAEGERLFTCKNDPEHTRTEVIAKLYDCADDDNCPSKDFTDVDRKPGSWSHEPIDWAVLKGITEGTSLTTFSPNKTCTRAEAVTFLWRAAGCPEPTKADSPFTDVTLDSWYAKAVLWAVEKGITVGTSDTTFSPEKTCTRAQIVTFLWRMEGSPKGKTTGTFTDVPATLYFAKAVEWVVADGVTNGVTPTEFAPNSDCTSAHITAFLWRNFELRAAR